jgi:hypothetical protein
MDKTIWTPILLLLLLVALVFNLRETRRMERTTAALYWMTVSASEHANENAAALNRSVVEDSTKLDDITRLLDCVANHRANCKAGQ